MIDCDSDRPHKGAHLRAPADRRTHSLQPYSRPKLTRLGTVRDLTLGSPTGVGDSGGALIEHPP